MTRWIKLLAITALFLFYAPLLSAQTEPLSLTILHINDFHGHLLPYAEKSVNEQVPVGGAAYLSKMIERKRAENPGGTLLLSAGDMFQGSPISNLFGGESVMEVMNVLRFDAMTLGNHEFDWGQEALLRLKSLAEFPFLSANIRDSAGNRWGEVKPYVLLTRKGLKIAVIGVTTTETPQTTKASNVAGLRFQDPVTFLPAVVKETRQEGADLVVVLSHMGLDADMELASRVEGIDVIVGGHSHTAVMNPVVERGTVIVQAGSYGAYLGVLELRVDPHTHKVISYTRNNELHVVLAGPDAPWDQKVAQMVAKYNDRIKDELSQALGDTTVDLVRNPRDESNIGDLIADAMREATGSEIAIQNGGGIRADIPTGRITLQEVLTVLPFDNVLITMDLKGDQLLQILKENASTDRKTLQISGMTVQYDLKDAAKGGALQVRVGEHPLDPDRVYRVTTNDFLAAGGDHFTGFTEGKNVVYGDTLRDVFVTYLRKHSPVSPHVENRIIFQR